MLRQSLKLRWLAPSEVTKRIECGSSHHRFSISEQSDEPAFRFMCERELSDSIPHTQLRQNVCAYGARDRVAAGANLCGRLEYVPPGSKVQNSERNSTSPRWRRPIARDASGAALLTLAARRRMIPLSVNRIVRQRPTCTCVGDERRRGQGPRLRGGAL